MVVQHLNLYDWGTSNPNYTSLASGFVQSTEKRGPIISDVGPNTPRDDPTVGGVFDASATDQRLLTELNCGEGSYLERVSGPASRLSTVGRTMKKFSRHRVYMNCWCNFNLRRPRPLSVPSEGPHPPRG